MAEMAVHGVRRDKEPFCHFAVGEPFGDELRNADLGDLILGPRPD